MTPVDYFAWFVFIVIIVSVVWVFVALAMLPGKIAKKRNHPQAEAINAAGWLGLLLTVGVVWALAVVWALMKPVVRPVDATSLDDSEIDALKARIVELEVQLAAMRGAAE